MTIFILIAWAVCIFWARQVAIRNGASADWGLVEQLIEYERKRNPQAGRLAHIQQAIDHWMLDNR